MLKYRVNRRKVNDSKIILPIENVTVIESVEFGDRKLVTCECSDIDKIRNGSFINVVNTLYINQQDDADIQDETDEYTFEEDYQVSGVDSENLCFSFFINKYHSLKPLKIEYVKGNDDSDEEYKVKDGVYLFFEENHYFDSVNEGVGDEGEEEEKPYKLYFKYYDKYGVYEEKGIEGFEYFKSDILYCSKENFDDDLFNLIFDTDDNIYNYHSDEEGRGVYEGKLNGIEIFRDNFLFGDNTSYVIGFIRSLAEIKIPIVNTFENNILQTELLNEYFVEAEKKKAINKITDIEKDVYYPCIATRNETDEEYEDVYRIKFNLHFREHRGDDWLVEKDSYWNGVVLKNGRPVIKTDNNGKEITSDKRSDLLSYLDFTNKDVYYQKNKLKKSFLRLMFFDSMNPANQNMISYSTIFIDSGELFAKYISYIDTEGYTAINADNDEYGKYDIAPNKTGIRVDRDNFDDKYDKTRLSSQIVVKSKNISKASSEGFYLYIWKDNEMQIPQDLYMKVEFNHAGYGRTIPFMMPYKDNGEGIKEFEDILGDWTDGGKYTIRQYIKYSYIHLKYRYDVENDKHIYYLDPETYGNIDFPEGEDGNKEIVINLYEAKVE